MSRAARRARDRAAAPSGSPGSTARSITASSPPDALLQPGEHLGRREARLPVRCPARSPTRPGAGCTNSVSEPGSITIEIGVVGGRRERGAHAVGGHRARRRHPTGSSPATEREDRQHAAAVGRGDRDDRQLLRLVDGEAVRRRSPSSPCLGDERDQQPRSRGTRRRRRPVADSPPRKRRRAASSAGSAEPSSSACGLARSGDPPRARPAESARGARSCGSVSGDIQRLGERERTRVERLADDRALDAERHELAQRGDVVEARDAARGDRPGWCVRSVTSRSRSRFGPLSVPSFVTSVTT